MRKAAWRAPALAIILYSIVCIIFVGDALVGATMRHEAQANAQLFGAAAVDQAQARATRWYNGWFVDTGMVAASEKQPDVTVSPGFTRLMGKLQGWLLGRMRVLWTLVYASLLRVSYITLWWPLLGLFGAAAVIDGFVRRRIKQTNLGLSSAERFGYALLGVQLLLMSMFAMLITPLPLPPLLPMICVVTIFLLVMVAIANAQKRL